MVIAGSSVNIPISLFTVMDKSSTGLCQRSLCCEASVNNKRVCSKCGKDLKAGEIGKGYVLNKEIIPIDEQQLEAIKPQGSDIIEVTGTLDTYPQIYDTDKKYWLSVKEERDKKTKDTIVDSQSREAYQLLSKALGTKTLIGKAVMRNKEYIIAINEMNGRLLLSCLYHAEQLKPVLETGYDDPQVENVKAVKTFIDGLPQANLEKYENTYAKNLMDMILGHKIEVKVSQKPKAVSNAVSMFASV